jgi:3D (Asp-Asp-Asp) domain-containing protein
VLGQAHTPRRRLLPYAAIVIAVLVAPAVSAATRSSANGLRAHETSLAGRSRTAVLGLYALDQQLANAQERLASLEHRQATLKAQRASLARALVIARRSTGIAQGRLAREVRDLYEQRTVEPIEIVLGSRSIDEAMSNIDDLNAASASNHAVIEELKDANAHLLACRHTLAERASALAAARAEAEAAVASLSRTRAARAAYVASLADERRMTAQRLAHVTAEAQAAVVRPARIEQVSYAAAGATLTVSATAYSLPGYTSSGLPVGWGVVAVDPSVIPLGTHMTIPGYGDAVAADTGTAIIGDRIDLWFPTLAQAQAWGRHTVTITLH